MDGTKWVREEEGEIGELGVWGESTVWGKPISWGEIPSARSPRGCMLMLMHGLAFFGLSRSDSGASTFSSSLLVTEKPLSRRTWSLSEYAGDDRDTGLILFLTLLLPLLLSFLFSPSVLLQSSSLELEPWRFFLKTGNSWRRAGMEATMMPMSCSRLRNRISLTRGAWAAGDIDRMCSELMDRLTKPR